VPYSHDFDDLLARLGGIVVVALKTRNRREGFEQANVIRFIFVCAFDTEFASVGFG
jgi:hypothetical protein